MTDRLSFNFKLLKMRVFNGVRGTTYRVRWMVDGDEKGKSFKHSKLAKSFEAKLLTAANDGIPFDRESGLPAPMAKALSQISWFDFAGQYIDIRWPHISPGHRRGISETLTLATLALAKSDRGKPDESALREAMHGWAFSRTARNGVDLAKADVPNEIADAIQWLRRNTFDIADMVDPKVTRPALERMAIKKDGKAAAPKTIARRRATFHGALEYAVEIKLLDANPLHSFKWKAPKVDEAIDRRTLPGPELAEKLIEAVGEINPPLKAFFGAMYYACMRPAEARHLGQVNLVTFPEEGWGEILLDGSTQPTGAAWSDSGETMEDRSLKHRSATTTRPVPMAPEYTKMLHWHLDTFGTALGGKLFVTRTGRFGRPLPAGYCKPVHPSTILRAWDKARQKVLTKEQYASKLAAVPYDLRHAGLTLWLNAGVPGPQVAQWAGHSLKVLLEVYAGCIDGDEDVSRARISAALAAGRKAA